MLKRLNPAQYKRVLPLYAPLDFNLVIRSVAEGSTPAVVFADRPEQPGVALIWNRQDALLLAGSNQDMAALAGLRNLLHNHILPEARARRIPEMALHYTPGWEYMLPSLLEGAAARPAGRLSFRYPPGDPPELPAPPPGYSLHRLDRALLAAGMGNIDQVQGWVASFWPSVDDFQRNGFGYCAVADEPRAAASWCLTVYAAGQAVELGVATVPEYRERGLAGMVAAACIRHALERDREVHWHCWADNRPSAAVAERLGFRLEREYIAYRLATGPRGGNNA